MPNNVIKKGLVIITFLINLTYAQKSAIELCVSFKSNVCKENQSNEPTAYSIHIKNLAPSYNLPHSSLPDSIFCECSSWTTPTYQLQGLPGESLPFFSFAVCSSVGETGIQKKVMPTPPTFETESSIGKQIHYATGISSKKEIIQFFGKPIILEWRTSFNCQGDSLQNQILTHKLDAVIVSECD
ncbi:MAG: hypothetical protein MJZ34_15660 [Paludibacteraceae bacterium]|nr:hypothetical protein [Paludibacteraceae bacterium]